MTDQELRDLVRDAISRHARTGGVRLKPDASVGFGSVWPQPDASVGFGSVRLQPDHASHRLLPLTSGSEGDGACLIEPTVRCVHCGYCQSYGH